MIAQAPNLLLTMINMMLKYGGSPSAEDEDYALYAVDNEFNSSTQVSYDVWYAPCIVYCGCVDWNTIFPCCAGCDMCSLDVIFQTNIFDCAAQTQGTRCSGMA